MNKFLSIAIIISSLCFVACKMQRTESAQEIIKVEQENVLTEEQYENTDYAEIGWELMKKESFGSFKLTMDSTDLFRLFGSPDVMSKEQFWGADGGFHSSWEYNELGVVVGMNRIEEDANKQPHHKISDRIRLISSSKLKSKRGIGIGSTQEEVLKVYAKAIEHTVPEKDYLIAGTVYGGLMFKIENNRVSEIFLGAMAE